MTSRILANTEVSSVGLGCMNLSHAYGAPLPREEGKHLLNQALDMGYTHLDTAVLYGFGANETLLGEAISHRREEFFLASKCGMFKNAEGKRTIDGRPEVLKKTCEESLTRLKTDVIDLYYLHRWDKSIPIEDSIGAMADLIQAGKIKSIGLSEVSATTLRKAHQVHPIAAVQTEYSLWTRNAEIAVLDACRELSTAFVAFSPLGRGYLSGELQDINTLTEKDIRRQMPRFAEENYARNLSLLTCVSEIASNYDVSMAQVALAWVLQQAEYIHVIPGTTKINHLRDNFTGAQLQLSVEDLNRLSSIFTPQAISGPRYNEVTQQEIDTEEYKGSAE